MDDQALTELIERIKQGDEAAAEALRTALTQPAPELTPEEQEQTRVQAELQRLGIVAGGAPAIFGGAQRPEQAQAQAAEASPNVTSSKDTWRSDRDRVTLPPKLWKPEKNR
jgi:hypothetical protein